MHTGVNKKQNNFEHFLTLSFSSFQGHNSVNFCPKSTSRTIFQHLRCRPFHSYQQKRSHWLKTLQKSDWTKSPSLCATYCIICDLCVPSNFLDSGHQGQVMSLIFCFSRLKYCLLTFDEEVGVGVKRLTSQCAGCLNHIT